MKLSRNLSNLIARIATLLYSVIYGALEALWSPDTWLTSDIQMVCMVLGRVCTKNCNP
jgi:hypothetical protein